VPRTRGVPQPVPQFHSDPPILPACIHVGSSSLGCFLQITN
jgi:hypothetical protein